jgi:hypothetical protein
MLISSSALVIWLIAAVNTLETPSQRSILSLSSLPDCAAEDGGSSLPDHTAKDLQASSLGA